MSNDVGWVHVALRGGNHVLVPYHGVENLNYICKLIGDALTDYCTTKNDSWCSFNFPPVVRGVGFFASQVAGYHFEPTDDSLKRMYEAQAAYYRQARKNIDAADFWKDNDE